MVPKPYSVTPKLTDAFPQNVFHYPITPLNDFTVTVVYFLLPHELQSIETKYPWTSRPYVSCSLEEWQLLTASINLISFWIMHHLWVLLTAPNSRTNGIAYPVLMYLQYQIYQIIKTCLLSEPICTG